MKVRLCDDDPDMATEWVSKIKGSTPNDYDVEPMDDAKSQVSELITRKTEIECHKDPTTVQSEFDSIDILVVDYDLVHLDKGGGRTTGEGIARLARTYSTCGAIAVINQFKGSQFDLGMRGHLDSFADLNLDAKQVGTGALWQSVPAIGEFTPTTWTPLPTIRRSGCQLAAALRRLGMDTPIAPVLGLDEAAIAGLSDTAFGFLSPLAETSDALAKETLRSFLKHSLGAERFEHMATSADAYLFSFAAFRLIKWLDRTVCRPMEVLIDVLHLIDRLPFVIDKSKVDVSKPEDWTQAAQNPKELLLWDEIECFHNDKASEVLGKEAFDWFRMVKDDRIEELHEVYLEQQLLRFHLAEDTSRFRPQDSLTRFRADFHNFGDRRAIEGIEGITYGPLRRMHFG